MYERIIWNGKRKFDDFQVCRKIVLADSRSTHEFWKIFQFGWNSFKENYIMIRH